MKLVLGFALMALATPLMATTGQNLADLLYVPNAGRFYGQTEMTWTSAKGEIESGTSELDLTVNTTEFNQRVGYGISDQLRVQLTYSNQLKGRTTIEGNGNSKNEGPSNPEASVLYRVLSQQDKAVSFDLFVNYSPDMIDSESNSAKNESNNAAGGSALTFGSRVGHKFDSKLELVGEAGITINGSSESEDTSTREKSKDDAYGEYRFKASIQYPLQENLWIRGATEFLTVSNREGRDSDGDKVKSDAYVSTTLTGTLLYAAIPDHLVFEAGLGLAALSDYEVEYADGTRNKFTGIGGSGVFLSALYQF